MKEIYKYYVKQDWIFNLESCHDKFFCLMEDMREGKFKGPLQIDSYKIEEPSQFYQLIDLVDELCWAAKCRKVSSREYGQIREFVHWRINVRYNTCLTAGMSEQEAGRCFEEI